MTNDRPARSGVFLNAAALALCTGPIREKPHTDPAGVVCGAALPPKTA